MQEGTWYKLGLPKRNIYRIDFKFLQSSGLNPETLNPTQARIFGYGGFLPQANAEPRPYDLPQVATHLVHDGSNTWQENTVLLFYGESTDNYHYDAEKNLYRYLKNVYADSTYYFLNFSTNTRLSMAFTDEPVDSSPPAPTFDSYEAYFAYEEEYLSLVNSGRMWLSASFSSLTQYTYEYATPLSTSHMRGTWKLESQVVGRSHNEKVQLHVRWQDQLLGTHQIDPVVKRRYGKAGRLDTQTFSFQPSSSSSPLSLNYELVPTQGQSAYLDYFLLQGEHALVFSKDEQPVFFRRSGKEPQLLRFVLSGDTPEHLWQLTPPQGPKLLRPNDKNNFLAYSNHEYVAFNPSQATLPVFLGQVPNQNLKSGLVPQLLIIAHPLFLSEAQRLAAHRESVDGLSTRVVSVQQVYNEFSSGKVDPTALRDYARFLDRQSPGTLRYLLLFGDCHYDIRNVEEKDDGTDKYANFVPTYPSRESLDPLSSYSSDDYFGFLETHDGSWPEDVTRNETDETKVHDLDIGIGRLPVRTKQEAQQVVDKIIFYHTGQDSGPWKRTITLVVDDGEANSIHSEAEEMAVFAQAQSFGPFVRKILIDSYPQEMVEGAQRSQACEEALRQAIDEGSFVVNFVGHGNPSEWMDEQVLLKEHLDQWTNTRRLPLFFTGTCEFGRYDDDDMSGGEKLLLLPQSGAIAVLTATRPIFGVSNLAINKAFYAYVFAQNAQGYLRLGDIMRHTKNAGRFGVLNRSFGLLGDPSMKLAYPPNQAFITHVNDTELTHFQDTLKSLSLVKLTGHIKSHNGQILSDYDGKLLLNFYDKDITLLTLGDENPPFAYGAYNGLFRGWVSVKQGVFSAQFFLSKNINHKATPPATIHLYAEHTPHNPNQPPRYGDAVGALQSLHLGHSHSQAENKDHTPPQIRLYLNDTTFRSGDYVAPHPILLAYFFDEHGINLSRLGPNKNIRATLKPSNQHYTLNDHYFAELNSYRKGHIQVPLGRLKEGRYTLELSASDNYNNSSTDSIQFVVSLKTRLKIRNFRLYPNPATAQFHMSFEHDKQHHLLSITLTLYNPYSAQVSSKNWLVGGNGGYIKDLTWKRNEQNHTFLRDGLYIYRFQVEDEEEGTYNDRSGKLLLR